MDAVFKDHLDTASRRQNEGCEVFSNFNYVFTMNIKGYGLFFFLSLSLYIYVAINYLVLK